MDPLLLHGPCRKAAVLGDEMLDFLKGAVDGVPDLGEEEEPAPAEAKPKRRRYSSHALKAPGPVTVYHMVPNFSRVHYHEFYGLCQGALS